MIPSSDPAKIEASHNAYRPAVDEGRRNMFDNHEITRSKLSYLDRGEIRR